MDSLGDDQIARLLRLKRYEQPQPGYFENFLHEFRRRQRDELLRQPLWRVCFERARGFTLRLDVRSLASAGAAAVVACAAVISLTIDRQPDTTQLAVQSSPVPSTPARIQKEFEIAPPMFTPTLEMQPALLRGRGDVRMLPAAPLRSNEFVPLNLEWESLEDQSPLEK
jgi:hypothetical protein